MTDQQRIDRRDSAPSPSPGVGWRRSLSTRVLGATFVFVFIAGLMMSLPWIAEFRLNWVRARVNMADVVRTVLDSGTGAPDLRQAELLRQIGAEAIAVRTGRTSRLIAAVDRPLEVDETYRIDDIGWLDGIVDSLAVMMRTSQRQMRMLGPAGPDGIVIDVVVDETMLREAMWRFARRAAIGSLAVAALAVGLVYYLLRRTFLKPLEQLGGAMARFRRDPENPANLLLPSPRRDEIGEAEAHLAAMQADLACMLRDRAHLADLGIAVSKINHDLRNILGAAQVFTDRISTSPDMTAQRFGPKLMKTLARAIGYSQAVLDYGKVREALPERRLVSLPRLVRDVTEILGLIRHPDIELMVDIAPDVEVDADPDQLFRVLMNLIRNAMQAVETDPDPNVIRRITVAAHREAQATRIIVSDTGPGVPQRARDKLFRPFEGGIRAGGVGLGLAICAELVRGHGGSIALLSGGPGAAFAVSIPDRPATSAEMERAMGIEPTTFSLGS